MLENIALGWIFPGDKFSAASFVARLVLPPDNGFCEIKFRISLDGSTEGLVE